MLLYLSIVVIGLGVVGWLFFEEKRAHAEPKGAPSLLDRLGLNGNPPKSAPETHTIHSFKAQGTEEPSLEKAENSFLRQAQEPSAPTIDPDFQLKYEKLELLLKEKSEELERKEIALVNELKAKKDFNKLKDILEKELKDSKDRNHKLQLEFSAAQAEVENYKKRTAQLDEKIKAKEQDILQKERQIDELLKRLQTFAAPQAQKPQTEQQPVAPEAPKQTPAMADTDIQPPEVQKDPIPPQTQDNSQAQAVPVTEQKPDQQTS